MVFGYPKREPDIVSDIIDKVRNPEKIFMPDDPLEDLKKAASKVLPIVEDI